MDTLKRLADAFYARVGADPLLRPMFRKNLSISSDRQAHYLAEIFGGPKLYSKAHGSLCLSRIHESRDLSPEKIEAWLSHMDAAMDEIGLPTRERRNMNCYFRGETGSLGDPLNEFFDMPPDELEKRLKEDPTPMHRRGARGTLVDRAAGRWDRDRVRLLLSLGALADHDALYHAANRLVPKRERTCPMGQATVKLLIDAGADVNARSGVGGQTPLHMAARRGNVRIARTLLDAGADLEAQDKQGETPLRRAVNCGHENVVRLLLERGADPNLPDRHGKTPLQAASKPKIVALFHRSKRKG
jgi:truncated hemoglobin YjbI